MARGEARFTVYLIFAMSCLVIALDLEVQTIASEGLYSLESVISSTNRAKKENVEQTNLMLCETQPLILEELKELLQRSGDVLRKNSLRPLINSHQLKYLYPTQPSHPQQAYATIDPINKMDVDQNEKT